MCRWVTSTPYLPGAFVKAGVLRSPLCVRCFLSSGWQQFEFADRYSWLVTSSVTVGAPMCEHSAVLYRGTRDLSRGLRSSLQRAAAEDAAVLICVDGAAEARIRSDFGLICDRFTFSPADDRYAFPGVAMVALDRFVTAAEASGAPSAWSIGAIPLRSDGRDGRWMQYEQAVNEIFADRPLRAVCLYDALETPAHLRDDVGSTHGSLVGDWARRDGDDASNDVVVPFPTRRSDLIIRDPTPAAARAAVERLMGWRVSRGLILDLQLVASELVTNAVAHGAAPAMFEVWHEADGCALRVTDSGVVGVPRNAHFRPPQAGQLGGLGLFTVGQIADSVEFVRRDGTTVVLVYISLRCSHLASRAMKPRGVDAVDTTDNTAREIGEALVRFRTQRYALDGTVNE